MATNLEQEATHRTPKEQQAVERREGDPSGTNFAVIVMMALLVAVAIYFVSAHWHDIMSEPSANAPHTTAAF